MPYKGIYVGFENEYQLMKEDAEVDFRKYFENLLQKYKKPFFKFSDNCIRTSVGSSLYSDGDEPEVCSAPVQIRKGFVKEATDNIYLARKELFEFISSDKELSLIGFSTHWNITNPSKHTTSGRIFAYLAVPFALFTLTPISCGTRLRTKESKLRIELLSDYIENEEQISAFLLFYAGVMLNINTNLERMPYRIEDSNNDSCICDSYNEFSVYYKNIVRDGRYSKINIVTKDKKSKTITAQDYLEDYYQIFKPGFEQIGENNDLQNLDDFVYGKKQLEIDKFKKYCILEHIIEKQSGRSESRYLPAHELSRINPDNFSKPRPVPGNLAKYFGSLANSTPYENSKSCAKHKKSPEKFPMRTRELYWNKLTLGKKHDYSIHDLNNIHLLSELVAQCSSDQDKVLCVRGLELLLNSDENLIDDEESIVDLLSYADSCKTAVNILARHLGDKMQAKKFLKMLKTAGKITNHEIGEIALDTEKIIQPQNLSRVLEYDSAKDSSIDGIVLEPLAENEFSWQSAKKKSRFSRDSRVALRIASGLMAVGLAVSSFLYVKHKLRKEISNIKQIESLYINTGDAGHFLLDFEPYPDLQ